MSMYIVRYPNYEDTELLIMQDTDYESLNLMEKYDNSLKYLSKDLVMKVEKENILFEDHCLTNIYEHYEQMFEVVESEIYFDDDADLTEVDVLRKRYEELKELKEMM